MSDLALPGLSQNSFPHSFDQHLTRVVIAYFDAGGGHRAAAQALQSVLTRESGWDVELLNLQDYLDRLDPSNRLIGINIQDIYNRLLNRGATHVMRRLLPILHGAIRVATPLITRRLENHWQRTNPDIVISVVPNLNRAIALSISRTIPKASFVTLLTDFTDTPPHFWIEKESQYLICGTQRATEQALNMGHSPERIFQTSGMILHPKFYAEIQSTVSARTSLGLNPDLTTLLVMFGGQGSPEMLQIANKLNECTSPLQVVYICGRNDSLRRELEQLPSPHQRMITGFTTDVPTYMAASDLMIGKPGPGTISEALHFGVPVIVNRNSRTMPQEIYNTRWVEEKGVGIVLRDFSELAFRLDALLKNDSLLEMKSLAHKERNNAIFEIPAILMQILETSSYRAVAPAPIAPLDQAVRWEYPIPA